AAGGWTIDLHPPRGFLDDEPPCSQTRLRDLYTIPFRSIYSRNVSNLLIASRCLSVTHVAHGSTRLQATLATVGQAAGIAAAWCAREEITPRSLGKERFSAYQQELCKRDGFLLDFQNDDPVDLAWAATVSASSSHPLHFGDAGAWIPLLFPVAQQFPAVPGGNGGEILSIDILVRNASGSNAHLEGGVREASRLGDFSRPDDIASMKGTCPAGMTTWVSFIIDPPIPVEPPADLSRPQLLWFYINPPPGDVLDVSIGKDIDHYPGFRGGFFDEDASEWRVARTHDKSPFFTTAVKSRGVFCFSIPGFIAFPAGNAINGYRRPGTHGSNLWMSDPAQGFPQWLELDLGEVHAITEIHLALDNGLDKAYPHAYIGDYQPWPSYGRPPRCPRDFDVMVIEGGKEKQVAAIRGNYQRNVVVKVGNISASKVKIVFHAGNGAKEIGVYEVRVY
ncbi:MAG: FAD-dependent oxidoreductase, partial [Candidatus Lokiarchaeota archaeon]|nr:FAD-dependent oxidoreductase [Candidatus Lokiarchaeota archaeon]